MAVLEQVRRWFDDEPHQAQTQEISHTADDDLRFFDLSLDMLCIADTNGYFKKLNPSFKNILGYELEELMSKPFFDFVHPDDLYATINETEKLRHGIPTIEFENRYRCKDGTYKWISWHCMPHENGSLYAVARDVTKEKEIQKTLQASVREKDVLLKEIHHRVKNNLQVISSLINMQIRNLVDAPAKDALIECQTRIQAIALIHEKLYQSADYARVSFSEYVQSLMADIFHALGVSPNTIALELNIPRMLLPIDKAIPCALILNELVTNSLKHAFPEERRGVINVSIYAEIGYISMTIKDTGVGLPENINLKNSPSLGLQLVNTLLEQLKASIEIDRTNGTAFTIHFAR